METLSTSPSPPSGLKFCVSDKFYPSVSDSFTPTHHDICLVRHTQQPKVISKFFTEKAFCLLMYKENVWSQKSMRVSETQSTEKPRRGEQRLWVWLHVLPPHLIPGAEEPGRDRPDGISGFTSGRQGGGGTRRQQALPMRSTRSPTPKGAETQQRRWGQEHEVRGLADGTVRPPGGSP